MARESREGGPEPALGLSARPARTASALVVMAAVLPEAAAGAAEATALWAVLVEDLSSALVWVEQPPVVTQARAPEE